MTLGVGSFMKTLTQLTRVYNKMVEFRSILTNRKCKVQRHMDKVRSVVPKKMDPRYSFGGLSSQQSISCEPSIDSFPKRNEYPLTLAGHLHA
jgi:hypothetical protein